MTHTDIIKDHISTKSTLRLQTAYLHCAWSSSRSLLWYAITSYLRHASSQYPATPEDKYCRKVAAGSDTERAFIGQTVNGHPYDNKKAGLYVAAVYVAAMMMQLMQAQGVR